MKQRISCSLAVAAALTLSACDTAPPTSEGMAEASPQDAFFAALASHCGKAYAGKLVSVDEADADFSGRAMVMHVRECSDERIAVPFHVETQSGDWDRSRTWLITRTDAGLRLKHDHRHEDGKPDAVTMYGGDTDSDGTTRAQDFPVDAESITMFEANDLAASVTNVWTVEVDPANGEANAPKFAYQLKRTKAAGAPEDRFFRVEFDLSQPVDAPPAPWGAE